MGDEERIGPDDRAGFHDARESLANQAPSRILPGTTDLDRAASAPSGRVQQGAVADHHVVAKELDTAPDSVGKWGGLDGAGNAYRATGSRLDTDARRLQRGAGFDIEASTMGHLLRGCHPHRDLHLPVGSDV